MDNTSGENKNFIVLACLAALVGIGVVPSVTAAFLRVGHTHEDMDVLWGINATVLGKCLQWDFVLTASVVLCSSTLPVAL